MGVVTQATISFLQGILEYTRLENKIVSLNRSVKDLSYLLTWWDGLTFVEKRSSRYKDQLVERTEMALMAEVEMAFSDPITSTTSSDDGVGDDEPEVKQGSSKDGSKRSLGNQ